MTQRESSFCEKTKKTNTWPRTRFLNVVFSSYDVLLSYVFGGITDTMLLQSTVCSSESKKLCSLKSGYIQTNLRYICTQNLVAQYLKIYLARSAKQIQMTTTDDEHLNSQQMSRSDDFRAGKIRNYKSLKKRMWKKHLLVVSLHI